jgi:hypothetical protein
MFLFLLGADNYLKIYEVDLDEFDIPTPKWKGCFGTNISVLISTSKILILDEPTNAFDIELKD